MTAKAKLADIKIVQVQLASLPERVWVFFLNSPTEANELMNFEHLYQVVKMHKLEFM